MDFVAIVCNVWLSFSHWMLVKKPVTLQESCISLEATGVRVLGTTTTEEMPTEEQQKKIYLHTKMFQQCSVHFPAVDVIT